MRVFLALQSKDLESNEIDRFVLGSGIAYPHRPKDRHLTLSFMGEVSGEDLTTLIADIDQLMTERSEFPVTWSPTQVSDFPSRKPKVWGWQGPMSASLSRFYADLAILPMLKHLLPREQFKAHVSFAYLSQPSGLIEAFPRNLSFHRLVLCRSFGENERQVFAKLDGWAQPRYEQIRSWKI